MHLIFRINEKNEPILPDFSSIVVLCKPTKEKKSAYLSILGSALLDAIVTFLMRADDRGPTDNIGTT